MYSEVLLRLSLSTVVCGTRSVMVVVLRRYAIVLRFYYVPVSDVVGLVLGLGFVYVVVGGTRDLFCERVARPCFSFFVCPKSVRKNSTGGGTSSRVPPGTHFYSCRIPIKGHCSL